MEQHNSPEQQSQNALTTQSFVDRYKRPLLLVCVLAVFGAFAVTVYAVVLNAPAEYENADTAMNTDVLQELPSQAAQNTNTENTNTSAEDPSVNAPITTTTPIPAQVATANSNTSVPEVVSATPNSNASSAEVNTNTARPANTNNAATTETVTNERDTQPIEQYSATVTVQGTGAVSTYTVSVPVGASVADLMALTRAQGLSYTTKQFGGLGAYVNSINGLSEDANAGMYWVYRVNNVKATAGISTKKLNRGDSVQWRYEREQ